MRALCSQCCLDLNLRECLAFYLQPRPYRASVLLAPELYWEEPLAPELGRQAGVCIGHSFVSFRNIFKIRIGYSSSDLTYKPGRVCRIGKMTIPKPFRAILYGFFKSVLTLLIF